MKEIRKLDMQFRAEPNEDEKMEIKGYAAVFNSPETYSYTEVIENLEPTVPIDISEIYFYPQKFAYDGKPHSISCKGIPEGVVVEYEGNDEFEAFNDIS